MRKAKIVCTLGPSSQQPEVFKQLVEAGLNVARMNFSHGDHEEHLARMNMVKQVREELGTQVSILLDTKGPEIRTGKFSMPEVLLKEGQKFVLKSEEVMGDESKCYITYSELYKDVKPGDRVLIDDGLIELVVEEIVGTDIHTRVMNSGIVKDKKGVNVPSVKINLPAITEKDRADILFGIENGIDFIAASFIRKASDVLEIRKILEENNAGDVHIISKIENQEGVDNLDEIIEVSDGLMVARGDLGVEIPTEQVPLVQKLMIKKCNKVGKPVITATQMLDSMIRNPRPTRAEATDVANAIYDGTDAIMLSGETAAGKYPVEAVKMMSQIAIAAEQSLDYKRLLSDKANDIVLDGVTFAVSHATATTANELEAKAIITATSSGFTARKLSMFRPKSPIVAACVSEKVARKLNLVWGVKAIKVDYVGTTDEIFKQVEEQAIKHGFIESGDLIVITAGVPVGIAGATNLMKIHIVDELLIKGVGIGAGVSTAKVCVATSEQEAEAKFEDGDILVTDVLVKELVPFAKRSSGIVVEEGGYTSAGALVAINLGIPGLVGATGSMKTLRDGMKITLDAGKNLVYSGKTRIL